MCECVCVCCEKTSDSCRVCHDTCPRRNHFCSFTSHSSRMAADGSSMKYIRASVRKAVRHKSEAGQMHLDTCTRCIPPTTNSTALCIQCINANEILALFLFIFHKDNTLDSVFGNRSLHGPQVITGVIGKLLLIKDKELVQQNHK